MEPHGLKPVVPIYTPLRQPRADFAGLSTFKKNYFKIVGDIPRSPTSHKAMRGEGWIKFVVKKVIDVKNLTKRYGDLLAVDNISFSVNTGEVFGLLGENGAGKTTTLEIIEGLRRKNSGKVVVLETDTGKNINGIKEKIGVQLQSSAYYDFLNLKEILELFGSFYKKNKDADSLLEMVDLKEKMRFPIKKLSGGQKQRFSIVASLVNDPDIVFLDEPTTGLDPKARRNIWEVINKIKAEGKTIILTTHYMEEAEKLCDRVAIMDEGKIVAMDETTKLIARTKNPFKIDFSVQRIDDKTYKALSKVGKLKNLNGKAGYFEIRFQTSTALNKGLDIIQKLKPESLTVGKATLEDLFIELTGKKISHD